MPIELLPQVESTLQILSKKYKLVVATKGDLLDQQRKLERSGIAGYFEHVEIMSDKTEKEYRVLLNSLGVEPEEFLMVGNSLKSDIQPVLAIGGHAVHVPFEVMWKHEVIDTSFTHPRLKRIHSLGELVGCIKE